MSEETTNTEQNEVAQELQTVTASVASFNQYQEGIAALQEAHPTDLVVPDIQTGKGMAAAIAGRAAWREPRIALDKARKAAKAPVLELGKKIDKLAAGIRDQLLIGEENYDRQIKAEEDRKEAIRAENARVEQERIQRMQTGIAELTGLPVALIGADKEKLTEAIGFLEGQTLDSFDDVFLPSAQQARDTSLDQLRTMLAAKVKADEQAERQAQAQAELDAQRAEQQRQEEERQERIRQEDAARAELQKAEDDQRAADQLAQEHISDIRTIPAQMVGKTAAQIEAAAAELSGVTSHHQRFGARQEDAQAAIDSTLVKLAEMQAAAAEQERIAAANEAERFRLAQEAADRQTEQEAQEREAQARRDQEEAEAEEQRQADARRESEAKAERDRQAAELAAARARRQLVVTMPDGSRWAIPAEAIVANHAAGRLDRHAGSEEESIADSRLALADDFELTDYAANNMDWSDVQAVARQVSGPEEVDYQEGWVNGPKQVIEQD